MTLNSIRRALYAWARFLGNVNAIRRGPGAVGRRIVRRAEYRTVMRIVRPLNGGRKQ